MKKLLHERLREEAEEYGLTKVTYSPDGIHELADEIERYYIPRPRFEDGEPVQFGDKVEGLPGCVYSFELFGDGSGRVIDFCNNDVNIDEEPFYLKRPQPKVLDADGIEIKVGDTVWDKDDPNYPELKVKEISPNGSVVLVDSCGFECARLHSSSLIHKEPDSLEKLRDDMTNYCSPSISDEDNIAMCDWVNRLSALIEKVD